MITSQQMQMPLGWDHFQFQARYLWIKGNFKVEWVNHLYIKNSNLYLYKTKNKNLEDVYCLKSYSNIDFVKTITSISMIERFMDHPSDPDNYYVKLYDIG